MRRQVKKLATLVPVAIIAACHSSVLVADGPVPVLEQPYPAGYPSTNPIRNRVVTTLTQGQRVRVQSEGYGKDFKYYKITLPAGGTGYAILGSGSFHVER